MVEINNVNLVYLRKARGAAPLSRFAVQEDGTLLVAAPDEMEARTSHVVRYAATGRSQILRTFNVETLRKIEIAGDATALIGITDDDLYLFHDGRKARFLPDRRAAYTDISLAATAPRFGAAFSDLLGSGHTVALGDVAGRVLWTKDVAFEIARVAVDRDAAHVLVAGAAGDLLLLDRMRQSLWSHRQDAPILAVATAGVERSVFACGGEGVASGGVGMVGADGGLLWYTELVGTPVEVAIDAAGRTVAVLVQLDAATGRVVFLSAEGHPTWDIDFDEARPVGLSLSPEGARAAVNLRDGSLVVYELQYGDRIAELSSEAAVVEARAARDSGNLIGAADLLRSRLEAVPSDCGAAALQEAVLDELRAAALAAAANAEAVGDWPGADERLCEALRRLPVDLPLVQARHALRERWRDAASARGRAALEAGDPAGAEAAFLDAVDADPRSTAARDGLHAARVEAARASIEEGGRRLRAGDPGGALPLLLEARRRGATGPEVNQLIRRAQILEAMSLGNALYQDRQYAAALFQFKKVLRLDPDHSDAHQKVSYAQNFLQDTQLNDRFTRLE